MDPALLITIIGIAVLGPIITLLWWKIADQWADAEKRRFKRHGPAEPPPQRKVIKGFHTDPPGQPRGS